MQLAFRLESPGLIRTCAVLRSHRMYVHTYRVTDRPTGERVGNTYELEGDRVLLPSSVEGGDTAFPYRTCISVSYLSSDEHTVGTAN
jgi:hypothetical protein